MKSHFNAIWLWLHSKRHRTYLKGVQDVPFSLNVAEETWF